MDSQSSDHKYTMTIGLSVLEHLGVGLYSNVPAVLSEAVANAWDADAENVRISIDSDKREITIYDDGHGMTADDINNKYLKVGYKKREREPAFGRTPRFNRNPMGRKGIGKLSLFSIANIIEIHTMKDNEKNALRMNSNDIRERMASKDSVDYAPEALDPHTVTISQGTLIKLSGLKKRIDRADEHLRKRLARRFSIIGSHNFNIYIDGQAISTRDRDYYSSIEYLWYFGQQSERYVELCRNAKRPCNCRSAVIPGEHGYRVSGWIGTVKARKQMKEETNRIVIFANGKLVHEDILGDMTEGGVWTKYIIGEIDADFLDDNHEDDIITSARQRLKEDEPRFTALRDYLKNNVIREISTSWQRLRKKSGAEDVLEKRRNIKRWLERFEGDQYNHAYDLLGLVETLDVERESDKIPLFRSIMYAFERLSVTQQLSLLNTLESTTDFELISNIFGNLADLTRVHYYDITKARIEVIQKFRDMIDENQKERVIQEHIFDALWLLDPSWERAATNSRMEETITKEFKSMEGKLPSEETRGRVDIRYQTLLGTHVIVELKRYGVSVKLTELIEQVSRYKSTLETCLVESYGEHYRNVAVEVICITGKRPTSHYSISEQEGMKGAAGIKCLTYDELIENALMSYSDYLKAEKRISELVKIIDSIEEDFETDASNGQ